MRCGLSDDHPVHPIFITSSPIESNRLLSLCACLWLKISLHPFATMLSKVILLLGAIASTYVYAAPTISERSPGSNWTIHDFTRTCNDTANTCLYTYTINENDGTPATSCDYTITGSKTVTAETTDYTALAGCSSPAYSLNQGWNFPGQFATLVVTNITSQFRVFYGFGIAQLGNGVVQADQTATSATSGVPPAGKRNEVLRRQGPGWTVQDFTWVSNAPLSSTYHFSINANEGAAPFECTVVDTPADPKGDWDNVPCIESDLIVISWGYSSEGFAVMTVRDNTSPPGSYALFGYGGVIDWSGNATPPDVGPQTVAIA